MAGQLIDSAPALPPPEIGQTLETALLLDAVFWYGGVDARAYPAGATAGAIDATRAGLGLPTISALLDRIVHREQDLQRLLQALANIAPLAGATGAPADNWSGTLAPLLRSTPFPKIWVADCVDVQLLQRLLTFLASNNLLARTALFVTAADPALLRRLQDAIAPTQPQPATANPTRLNIAWNDYSLLSDATFNEFEFILCGTVLHGLPEAVRRRAVRVLGESVSRCGLLQLAAPRHDDAAMLVPIFLPVADGASLYRHATLELQARQRKRR